MLRLHNIKLPLSYSGQSLAQAAAKALGVSQSAVAHCEISRKSVDARKKNDVCFVVALDVTLKNPQDEKRDCRAARARGRRFSHPLCAARRGGAPSRARRSPGRRRFRPRRSVRRADAGRSGRAPHRARTRSGRRYAHPRRSRLLVARRGGVFPFFQRAVRRGRRRHVFRWKAQHRHEGSARRAHSAHLRALRRAG